MLGRSCTLGMKHKSVDCDTSLKSGVKILMMLGATQTMQRDYLEGFMNGHGVTR